MKTKNLAIYNPKGNAREYARWACNLFNGCPHLCEYCYCRNGFMGTVLGGEIPIIKKTLGGDEFSAFDIFCKELSLYGDQIRQDGGLFFSFSTDPMVMAELPLTYKCIEHCLRHEIPVTILTKSVQWWYTLSVRELFLKFKPLIAIGLTLTGCDDLEPQAPSNLRRLYLLAQLKAHYFRTWASIEPIITPDASLSIMENAQPFCDHFKVGLRSGVKKSYYDDDELQKMFLSLRDFHSTIYLKESFVKRLGINRDSLALPFVGMDYRLVDA